MSFLSVSRKSLRRLVDDKRGRRGFKGRPRRRLRDDFKLISMWDFCLPRKQRTFLSLLSLRPPLFLPFCSSTARSVGDVLEAELRQTLRRPSARLRIFFPLASFVGARETSYIFYIPHRCLEAVFSPLQN